MKKMDECSFFYLLNKNINMKSWYSVILELFKKFQNEYIENF